MKKNQLTKTEQLQQLQEKRKQLYQDYQKACDDGDPDEAWNKVEHIDRKIIALIMSTVWKENV